MLHANDFQCEEQNPDTLHWTFSAHVWHREWVRGLEARRMYFIHCLLRAISDRLRDFDEPGKVTDAQVVSTIGQMCEG